MRKYQYIKYLFLLLLFIGMDVEMYGQSAQVVNPSGGTGLTDGLKVVVNTTGTLSVYRDNQTQYFSGYVWPDGQGNGVALKFRFSRGGTTYSAADLSMTACSTTPAVQNGNDWTTSISGYITSPLSSLRFYVTMNFFYTYPNKYFLVDYYVRAPHDTSYTTPETVHLYLDHDAYILGDDGSRGYRVQNGTGDFVGDYRTNENSTASKKNPRANSTHGFKTEGSFRSYYSGAYNLRNNKTTTNMLSNTMTNTLIDDGIAVEFTIGPLSLGQIGAKRVMHAYGDAQGEFDNTPVGNPTLPTGLSTPVTVNFAAPSFSENEGNSSHPANAVNITVSGGTLAQNQVCNFTVSGGTAVAGTDYTYVKGFIIPAGDYTSARTFTLNNITILGNTTCQNNRTFNISIDSEVCNDLVQPGSQRTAVYTIVDDDLPTVNQPASQTYCRGISVPANTFVFSGSTIPNTTYTWINNNTAIGLAASGTGNIPAFTTNNTTATPITATITVTPVQGTCSGDPKTFTITVNPTATVNAINDITACNGSTVGTISFSSPTPGATFTWTNSNPFIGLAASGSGNLPSFTATNSTAAPVTSTITVTPSYAGCPGTPRTFTITVYAPVVAGAITGNPFVCEGMIPLPLTATASTGGSSNANLGYQWQSKLVSAGSWTDIPGATGQNYTPASPLTEDTYFRRVTTDNYCTGFKYSSNEFLITIIATPTALYWNPNAADNNWNNPANWLNARTGGVSVGMVPLSCTDVYIPGTPATNYPSLDGNTPTEIYGSPVCRNITFAYGAELAFQHKLQYEKAYIQYNWGYYDNFSGVTYGDQPAYSIDGPSSTVNKRDRWYTLAAPLKSMATGDFGFSGYPLSWQGGFCLSHPETGVLGGEIETGSFDKMFSTNDVPLSQTNNAIAVRVASYRNYTGYSDHHNLEGLKGIIEIPYFENSAMATYYPGHSYDRFTKESKFFYFNTQTLQQIHSPVGIMKRGQEAYRFVYEDESGFVPAITIGGIPSTVPGYTQRVERQNSTSLKVMIGNPFMASINAKRFFEVNSTKLNETAGYQLFNSTSQSWEQYSFTGSGNISPLQAFIVTLNSGQEDLVFPLEGSYALTGPAFRGSPFSLPEGSSLYLRSANSSGLEGDYSILEAPGTNQSGANVRKMLHPQGHATPETFFIAPDNKDYNLVQAYESGMREIGIGVKSSDTESTLSLIFGNADKFYAWCRLRPVLVDKYKGIRQDLLLNNTYTFNQRPTDPGNNYIDAGRFALQLLPGEGTLLEASIGGDVRILYRDNLLEISSPRDIKQVEVYDMLGRRMHSQSGINTSYYTRSLSLNSGVYIVKVYAVDGEMKTGKIIAM